jgi:hypothetical protein
VSDDDRDLVRLRGCPGRRGRHGGPGIASGICEGQGRLQLLRALRRSAAPRSPSDVAVQRHVRPMRLRPGVGAAARDLSTTGSGPAEGESESSIAPCGEVDDRPIPGPKCGRSRNLYGSSR